MPSTFGGSTPVHHRDNAIRLVWVILFLDEFPEFGTRVLQVMRQPMEDKVVTISRAKGTLTFSANFQLIAAMNPCPCGFYGDSQKPCTCAHALVTKY